jgi:hypothetical protein
LLEMKTSLKYNLSAGPAPASELAVERAQLLSVSQLARAGAFFRFKLAAVLFFVMAAVFSATTTFMPAATQVVYSSFVLSGALWLGAGLPLLDMAKPDGTRRPVGLLLLIPVSGYSIFGFFLSSAYAIHSWGVGFGIGLLVASLGALGLGFMFTRGRSCTVTESERALDWLEPISLEHCSSVLGWCRRYPELEAYRAAVAAQARMLTNYEYAGMHGLVAGHVERTRWLADETACARLLDPAPLAA